MSFRTGHDAHSAYLALSADFENLLRPSNALMEIAGWKEVSSTIDSDKHVFRVRISNIEKIPISIPATGTGYQIIDRGSIWSTSHTSPLIREHVSGTVIAAPTKIDGSLIVSYRFSLIRWIRAWILWLILLAVRVSIATFVVALCGIALWYVPWSKVITITIVAIKSTVALFQSSESVFTPTPTPTSTPMPNTITRGIRI